MGGGEAVTWLDEEMEGHGLDLSAGESIPPQTPDAATPQIGPGWAGRYPTYARPPYGVVVVVVWRSESRPAVKGQRSSS